ncbi:amidohydrolase [Halostreptopolyspora alba]|uniref:Amidohydrolase n=2 Tax=Halostreptopolyspora alba TaxID=2487137 RepID=A0A3N0EEG1_9ACTN|nr:amidohydrolase [Nocardiopsaceae bacterium YIM 96095]
MREDLRHLYQHLHRAPELSMREYRTAALITERMTALGFSTFACGGTGVVAVLRNGDGPVVAFRADTDALPVAEETGLPYASTARGTLRDGTEVPVMHACGHDMHVTAAIGAATLLADTRHTWAGTVVFLFQPGEETSEGARAMVDDGLWEKAPRPEVVYGQHVWPGLAGTAEINIGTTMAMADSWKVTVRGRGGHGSRPENTIDPVVLAAHMVVRIQSVVSREVPSSQAAVVTVGSFHAGLKENVIPGSAAFTLNVRHIDPETRERTLAALHRVITAEAQASGAPEPELEELYTFPLLVNDTEEAAAARSALEGALGADSVTEPPVHMGSEDFGHLPDAAGVPGVYWFFGGLPDEVLHGEDPAPSNHSPHFSPVIEPTLTTGVTAAYTVLVSRLGNGSRAGGTGR